MLGLEIPPGLIVLGLIAGMTYGVIAVGLVLVYRTSRVINFAHGEIGAFGAAVCGLLVVRYGVPYWVAFVAALVLAAAIGGGAEAIAVRRLRHAPKIMSLVATLGAAQVLLLLSATVNSQVSAGSTFPQPPGLPIFNVGVFRVTPAYSAMLFLSPLLVVALAVFLQRSRFGLALRASSANEERAQLLGVSAGRMSTMAWCIAGGLSAYTAMMIIPTRGFITAEFLGPTLLLRALVPAVLARFTSLPVALVGGVGVGLVEQVLVYNYPTSGIPDLGQFLLIVGALLFQRRGPAREIERSDWGAVLPWPRGSARHVPALRRIAYAAACATLALAVLVGMLVTNTAAVSLVAIAAFTILGLSVGVVSGLSGQLSLGQFAIAGVGAVVSVRILAEIDNFPLAVLGAVLASSLASMIVGIPALRLRGLMLAVTSLAFAVAAQRWLFAQPWALGDGRPVNRPRFGSLTFDTGRKYYWIALAVTCLAFWLAHNVWRSDIGLRLRAVRDNENASRSIGIWPTRVRLEGLAIGGVLAGLSGAVFGHLVSHLSPHTFDVSSSVNVVALTVLGGIGLLAGPLLGALYIIGVPAFLPLDSAGLAATSLGWLVLILYFPGGLAQTLAPIRNRIVQRLDGMPENRLHIPGTQAERLELLPEPRPTAPWRVASAAGRADRSTDPPLEAHGLTKRYGGVVAVDAVDLVVQRGEILGLIGSNGAGKTTLFELMCGFVRPDEGIVRFEREDVTRLRPEQRAAKGLVRSFQDGGLFPTLTVTETLALALAGQSAPNLLTSCLGWHGRHRERFASAADIEAMMGLSPFADKAISELSTGTRRVVELACMLALRPSVILLDEPSSGIAQREVESLGRLLSRVRDDLDATLVLIEHDMPLVMSLADRVIAMDSGRIIATGTPEEVRNDPAVVRAYLGGAGVALERSGSPNVGVEPRICSALTRAGTQCTRTAGEDGWCLQHRRLANTARP